jgi:hypothetical protein
MIRNIVYSIMLVAIVVPSWQIGSIIMEKQSVAHLLKEQANSVKSYSYSERGTKNTLKKKLTLKGLPTEFFFEALERKKVKISYQYYGAATVFGYTYYQTSETLSAETID